MALPVHLAKYDQLLDLIVEVLVREIESDSQPSDTRKPAAVASVRALSEGQGNGKYTPSPAV